MASRNAKVSVAAIQMECLQGNKTENMKKAFLLMEDACSQGAKLALLPELFSTGYCVRNQDLELAERIPGETIEKIEHFAKAKGVCVSGTILEHGESKGVIYDTAFFITPEGNQGTYRKIFLWDSERTRFKRADCFPVFDSGIGKIGIQICYEIGFPEGARILALKGADILLYPSAFGAPRFYVWDVATRSRALENGAFLIAANRSGKEDGIEFAAHSRIVNPRGEVLCEAQKQDEVIVAEIDLDLVPLQRRAVPYLRDYERGTIIRALNEL